MVREKKRKKTEKEILIELIEEAEKQGFNLGEYAVYLKGYNDGIKWAKESLRKE